MPLVQREQRSTALRRGWLDTSKQACPLVAGTIALRAIAKCKETMTLTVSTGGSWLKLPCYTPLQVKSNLTFVSILTTLGVFFLKLLKQNAEPHQEKNEQELLTIPAMTTVHPETESCPVLGSRLMRADFPMTRLYSS